MSDIKTEEPNVQTCWPKRITYAIFVTLIFLLLLLSISGFLIMLKKNNEKGFKQATNKGVPTPTPSPTSIYLETPPAQSEFYDTFKNNALGWSASSTAGYYRTIKPGELILRNTNRGTTMVESLPTNSIFDNCTVIVDLTILKAGLNDSVGIYIRGDTNLEHDYRIDLNGDGTFDIAKESLDFRNLPQSVILVGPKSDSALHPQGERNTITLTMNGSILQLFINSAKVSVVADSDYKSGQVALLARLDKGSQDVSVSFNKVEIDKLKGAIVG